MAESNQAGTAARQSDEADRPPQNPAAARQTGRLALIAAAVLVVAVPVVYWWVDRGASLHYLTGAASRGDVLSTVTASGTVNPVTTIQVGTYVSGVIEQLHCDFNTRVKAGQLCAKIDPRPYQTIVDGETAALGTARAQLAKDRANLSFAQVIYDRDVDLLQRRIVSQETVDTASNALAQAGAQIALDQSTVRQHLASLSAANVNLGYTDIISPVDGTVVSRNVTQGQTVAASFQTPTLFLIATDLTQMQVDTNVSESDIGNVAVGEKVLFTVEAYPDQTFTGSVTQVRQAPQSVQNVITYDAVASVPNPQLLLKPGMTAAARIVTAEHGNVLRVPNQALRFSPSGPVAAQNASAPAGVGKSPGTKQGPQDAVWRLQDGRPVRVPVKVGLDDGTFTEVASGSLAAGDQIIIGMSAPGSGARPGPGGTAGAPRLPRM